MRITYLLYSIIFIFLFSCAEENKTGNPIIHIGNNALEVEIADTPEKRMTGLMNRAFLDKDKGMLFIFEKEQPVYFWMKDTGIPLSIAYINRSGYITEIYDLEPFSLQMVRSTYPVLYALEVNRGYFKQKGIKTGDVVRLSGSY